jgi:glycosyltransferase involved in cell wall biosynthesis
MLVNLNEHEKLSGGIADYNRQFFQLIESAWESLHPEGHWVYACLGSSTPGTFWRALFCRLKGGGLIATMHDGPLLNRYPFSGRGWPKLVEKVFNHSLGRLANFVLLRRVRVLFVLTKAGERAVGPRLPSSTRLIHVPIYAFINESVRQAPPAAIPFRRIYFLGGVRTDKRFDLFLEFCRRVREHGLEVAPTIIGRIVDRGYYDRCVSASGWSGPIHQHSPALVGDFAEALREPGVAFFCYERRTVSASAAVMHAIGGGLPVLCPEGSTIAEYLFPGAGFTYADMPAAVARAVEIFRQPPTSADRLRAIAEAEARYGLASVQRQVHAALAAADLRAEGSGP